MNDINKLEKARRSFKNGIPLTFVLSYGVVAGTLAYYCLAYIEMVKAGPVTFILLVGLDMVITYAIAMIIHTVGMRDINLYLSGTVLDENRLSRAKIKALNYPLYLIIAMIAGWTIIANAAVFIPIYLKSGSSIYDLVIINLLALSGGSISILITLFISESSVSGFLTLPEIGKIKIKNNFFNPTISLKIIMVCLVIIISLSLNFTAATMIINTSIDELSTLNIGTNIFVAFITGIVSAILVSSLFMRSLKRRIGNITEVMNDVGKGNLTRSIAVASNDEIGTMARNFNITAEHLKQLVVTIKNEAKMLYEIGVDLSGNMHETTATVKDIVLNIQGVKGQAVNQGASVTETKATMEAITKNINKLNTYIESQSASVTQSSASIEQMLANIKSVTDTLIKNSDNVTALQGASEVGRNGLQEVSVDIREIARESEGLLEINAVMKNIASQTNLLSMNAAIEAAHAGDAGKGFAVVADEIRKLAENSGEQSKTIGSVLKKIKGSIDKITISTDNVLQRFEAIDTGIKTVAQQEENIRRSMEEQAQGSKQILETIGHLNVITHHVKTGSNDMLGGAKEVIQESKSLEKVAGEITGSMNKMATSADQVKSTISLVNDISEKNRESVNLLIKDVSRFNVEETAFIQ